MSYPPIPLPTRADRFLFDAGYSWALLARAQVMLTTLIELARYDNKAQEALGQEAFELAAQIAEFLAASGQQTRDDLYAAGAEAAQKLE